MQVNRFVLFAAKWHWMSEYQNLSYDTKKGFVYMTLMNTIPYLLTIDHNMSLKSTLESSDTIKYELYLRELTEETVRNISADQKEPQRMLDHRLQCLEVFKKMKLPTR